MPPFGTGANQDGESLLVSLRNGRWRAEGVDRFDLVAEAEDLDALRPAIIDAALGRRRSEGLAARTWKVAYVWTIDIAPRQRGLLGTFGSVLRGKAQGPVLEVTPNDDGCVGRAEDASTVSAQTLAALNEAARQRHAPRGAESGIESITLFEVVEIPPEAPLAHG